jgi:peroxiredoxin
MNNTLIRHACFLLFALTMLANATDQVGVRAALQTPNQRNPAPKISLQDASGKTIDLNQYRGTVVLLDFWATWCHGCGEEIPWFSELHRKYGAKGLTVVGVSMDADGWKVVKPFIKSTHIPYTILLGNDGTGKLYGIEGLTDTFLIDREGRIAAAYRGLVDKHDIETNIEKMLVSR